MEHLGAGDLSGKIISNYGWFSMAYGSLLGKNQNLVGGFKHDWIIFHFMIFRDVSHPSHWFIFFKMFFLATNQKWFSSLMFLHPRSQVYVSGVASISPSVLTRGPTRVLNMTCEPSTCSSTLATTPGGSGRHGRPFFHSPGPSFPGGDGYPSMNWVQYTRYGMDDNNPFSSFFFFNEQRGHMSSVQNPCCLMIVWDSTVGEYHNPKSENNRMDHMDHMVTMRSTEQKHAKNPQFGSEISAALAGPGVSLWHKIVWFNASTLLEQFCAFPISLHILDHPTPPRNFVP